MVAIGETVGYFVLIEFDVTETTTTESSRPEINLTLVLDRSGSMEDKGKMEYMLKVAKQVIDRLGKDDRLAIFEFDDEITVLLHPHL